MILKLMQFITFRLFIYLEHKIKRILALSLNWKVNCKLFNPDMGQNGSMYIYNCVQYIFLSFIKTNEDKLQQVILTLRQELLF